MSNELQNIINNAVYSVALYWGKTREDLPFEALVLDPAVSFKDTKIILKFTRPKTGSKFIFELDRETHEVIRERNTAIIRL